MVGRIIKLKEFIDSGGSLVVAENLKEIPFNIKRIFYVYGVPKGVVRGKHSNRYSSFVFICLSGSVRIKVDNGEEISEYMLNTKSMALYIENNIWKEMYDFSDDCVLLCLSDKLYDENEYITEYKQFKERG